MTAGNLLTLLREQGVEIRTSGGGRLVIDAPKGTITPQLREELAANKADLLRILQSEQFAHPSGPERAAETAQPSFKEPELPPVHAAGDAKRTTPSADEIARLEAQLDRLRTEEQARRAEVETARLATENALRIEQERWQQAEHETALRRAEKEKQRIESEAHEHASEETRRRIADQEVARAEEDVRRMRAMEESRRADFEAQMRAAQETHRLQLESLRKAEEDQAHRRIEEERRYLEVMARNKAQEDELRRAAEQRMQTIEEQILRIRADESARERAAQEEHRIAEETARKREEEEARRLAEAEARRKAEEEARLRAEIEAQLRAEVEARLKVEDEARRRAEEEARRRAEEEAQRLAAEEARRRAEAEERRRMEELIRREAEEAARLLAAEEARLQAEERARLRAEAEMHERAEAAARQRADLEARIRAEVEAKLRAEEAERRSAEEATHFTEPEPSVTEIPEWYDREVLNEAKEAAVTSSTFDELLPSTTPEETFGAVDAADEFRAVSLPEVEEAEDSLFPASIRDQLRSERPGQRARAVADLSGFGGEDAFRSICDAFDDPSIEVRSAAARALFAIQEDRAAAFTRALREAPSERRLRIGAAIASSGLANEAIGNLTRESRDKTYDAFSLLFLMSKAGEVQPLMRAIEEYPTTAIRLAVIKLLALSGQADVLPAFRRMAVRGSLPPDVRSALMEAIYQITSQTPADDPATT